MKYLESGSDGEIYLTSKNTIIKQFKSTKKKKDITREYTLQLLASIHGLSPKPIRVDYIKKQIEMEYIHGKSLMQYLEDVSNNKMANTFNWEGSFLNIMKKLDELNILHNDPNPLNIIINDENKMYIIDYGMAEKITNKSVRSIRKQGCSINRKKINQQQMSLGLLIILKKYTTISNYKQLLNSLAKKYKKMFV